MIHKCILYLCYTVYTVDIRDWGVLRGYWYEVIGEKWYPILEEEYRQIEAAHLDLEWRGKVGGTNHMSKVD